MSRDPTSRTEPGAGSRAPNTQYPTPNTHPLVPNFNLHLAGRARVPLSESLLVRPTMKHVVIVGGGIAGLGAAYYLRKSPEIRVTVLEGSDRFGGKVGTEHRDGFLIE